jgi:hypothetical protein
MSKKPNISGGGSNTNLNGLSFEDRTCLIEAFKDHEQIDVNEKNQIIFNGENIGFYTEKHNFYKDFLKPFGINYKDILSKKLLPDSVFVNTENKTVYVIEKKFQKSEGSVDEKLQTGPYKKRMFVKLCAGTEYNVEYYYLLNEWYSKNSYRDVKDYLRESGCRYYTNTIPLYALGV